VDGKLKVRHLKAEGDQYLVALYNGTATGGNISISGSQIMPEFGSSAILVVGAAILTAVASLRYRSH